MIGGDVMLLCPRFSKNVMTDPREDWLYSFGSDGQGGWTLLFRFRPDEVIPIPICEGDPQGELLEVEPGVRIWGEMERYGLTKLGSGVWRMDPSLWVPGELHAFLVLCDVPDPAPFAAPLILMPGVSL